MLMPASSEFVALCRAQVTLLTQGLGASLSVVYLTEELNEGEEAKLTPVVAYPETAALWDEEHFLTLLPAETGAAGQKPRLLLGDTTATNGNSSELVWETLLDYGDDNEVATTANTFERQSQQLVVPLVHEGVVMGLLVTAREDRPWNEHEHEQIEQVASTLAIACLLDQRGQWLEQERRQQHLLQAQQHRIFDNLLHQFRNPLTALRTFGKLLLRRLGSGDPNRDVAASMVRESDRLQELLQQFDQAVDLGRTERVPFALQPATQPSTTEPNPEAARIESPPIPLLPGAGFLGGAQLTIAACDIATILEPLIDSAEAIAQERQIQLYAEIPAPLPPVAIDRQGLREVLSNLIDNALKYTPAGGQVYIQAGFQRLWPTEGQPQHQLGVAVWDTGPGIPPQDLQHVFERHYRGVQANTAIPGTGLGLAIAQDLIKQMQGEIQVFSPAWQNPLVGAAPQATEALGPGTAFVVWLPLAADEPQI